ncbi:gamma-glutamylcyclotransferase [Caballeronia sp. 15715]|uniref:gamma-glutamylcyclotransferase n=1 Tax=Caballeronia sp. 15715 TaxID=3391030 RepID=UPI0039E214DF
MSVSGDSGAGKQESAIDAVQKNDQVLDRALLETGGVHAMVVRDAPEQLLLTDAQRAASLDRILERRPPGAAWIFAYGSLMWNPIFLSQEQRKATIFGFHRSFCFKVYAGRGSLANPGLVLALDQGGECTGVAYRIGDEILRSELDLLWRREMLSGAYIPQWVEVFDDARSRFGCAIAFTMDANDERYTGKLDESEVVRRLATAAGALGSASDYLFKTCEALKSWDISDSTLERLTLRVQEYKRDPD